MRGCAAARTGQAAPAAGAAAAPAGSATADPAAEDEDDDAAGWSAAPRAAEGLGAAMAAQWGAPIDALSKAGKAFEGLEALLGGGTFDLKVTTIQCCHLLFSHQRFR